MSLGYGDRVIDVGWRRWRTGIAKYAARQVEMIRDAAGFSHNLWFSWAVASADIWRWRQRCSLIPIWSSLMAAPADLEQVALISDVAWQWVREYGVPTPLNADYRRESVCDLDKLKNCKVLLSHGFNDDLVPVSHAVGLYGRLKFYGVDTALAIFQDEGHSLTRVSNQKDWFRWVIEEMANAIQATDRSAP
ncbi:prolyl oligopeptidase family serine peptidase [Rhizobium leguminosarum]|uniref:alpha/beta hydrolase family protein n=1 Tax=Rhizobium leguminosarum TaxID=384 RepID=UPI001C95E99A|nr:prolyl oligopeptidase family serine peptidase [Rhizobium leguminosarum]MBY5775233.1 prolyl oligopeptidase family serine peptidase [Rhizobium leguminosarum]